MKHFLTLKDFTREEIEEMLELARKLKIKKRLGMFYNMLSHKNVALLFKKHSTRTRNAFIIACTDEGAHAEFVEMDQIHLYTMEDLKDTINVLSRMYDVIVFRGNDQSEIEEMASYSKVPVINALTNKYHPTQALADVMTMFEHLDKKDINLTFIGDGHNNVCSSLLIICSKLGINFNICTPNEYPPNVELFSYCKEFADDNNSSLVVTNNVNDVISKTTAIYTDLWVGMNEFDIKDYKEKILAPYQLNMSVVDKIRNKDFIVLHCLPAIKGKEITEDVFDLPNSKVYDQAENRLHTIKSVLISVLM
jgi:ornithine carbamoyltransferase